MHEFSTKTNRAIKAYGITACRDAFRMLTTDGSDASRNMHICLNLKGTQAKAAIEAGREIAEVEKLTCRIYFKEGDAVDITVSSDEWRAELPAMMGCYSLSIREYQINACVKKARSMFTNPIAFQLLQESF